MEIFSNQEISAIRAETLRYFACAASYECAPFASWIHKTVSRMSEFSKLARDFPVLSRGELIQKIDHWIHQYQVVEKSWHYEMTRGSMFPNNFRRKILHPFWVFSHTCIFSCFFSVLQFQLIFFPVSIGFKLPKSSPCSRKKIGQRPSSPIVTGASIGHFPWVRRRGDRGAWRYHSSLGYSRCGCGGGPWDGRMGSWLLLGGGDFFFLIFYPYLEKWSNLTTAHIFQIGWQKTTN